MVCKLAWRNVRRSIRDYAIYFITLLFGVAVFYAFNSIESQQVLFDIQSQASAEQLKTTAGLLGLFSGVIACVLGFLVLYANRFLIRRRKQEFGIYLLLGMKPRMVSAIVLVETVLVGLIALVVGLLAGIALSQGLSFLTAGLFGVVMSDYQFVFSQSSFVSTIIYFGVIFAVVALFNTLSVSRVRLINLLKADSANEKTGVRNPIVCAIVFVVALAVLVFAYAKLDENNLLMLDDPAFLQATIAMMVGSLLLFWSLAGLVVALVSRSPQLYLRRLRPFTLRQVASRINTAFVSLWAVCMLLFFSITCFSCGMGLADVFSGQVEAAAPYDATMTANVWISPTGSTKDRPKDPLERRVQMEEDAPERLAQAEAANWDMAVPLQEAAPDLWAETVGSYGQVDVLSTPGFTFGDLTDQLNAVGDVSENVLRLLDGRGDDLCQMVGVSQLNSVRALQGQDALELAEGQWALLNNMDALDELAQAFAKARPTLTIAGVQLAGSGEVVATQVETSSMLSAGMVLIVPDSVMQATLDAGYIPEACKLDIMFANNGKTAEENNQALQQILAAAHPADEGGFDSSSGHYGDEWAGRLWPVTSITSQEYMFAQSRGMKLMITYLALYIGFVFMVSTAAILAIQQLSNVADSTGRYRTLNRLGCDRRQMFHSLLAQTCLYFLAPLVLALCHSAYVISMLANTLFAVTGTPMLGPIASAGAFLLVIYGGYLLVTYFTSRSMVGGALREG